MTTVAEDVRSALPLVGLETDATPFIFTERTIPAPALVPDQQRPYVDVIVYQVIADQGTVAPPEVQERFVGRVQRARRALTGGREWIGAGYFFVGAELNPAPVHDHHYRILNGGKQLVRYDANIDRWWIIKGEGEAPWVPDDYFINTPSAYFEVQYSGEITNLDLLDEEEEVPDIRDMDAPRFHGKAVVNAAGRVERVTEFEDYTLYVGYSESVDDGTRHRLRFGLKAQGQDELLNWGWWDNAYGGNTMAPELTQTWPDDMVWAKAVVTAPTAPIGAYNADHYRNGTQDRLAGFERFNDALNELANQESWCGEYERIMGEVGMRSRRSTRIRLYADVIVNVSAEVDSPRYQVSNQLESEYEVDDVSNLRFDARITVQVPFIVDRDSDYDDGYDEDMDPEDHITQDMVSSEVDSRLGNLTYEIDDWSIDGGVMLSDDQDDI